MALPVSNGFVWQDHLMARKDPKYASLSRYAHEAQ